MTRGFRRSAVVGIGGVFVVAGICVAIALSVDPADADPTLQYGLIFAVIAVYLAVLFAVQRADLRRATRADSLQSAAGAREIDNPTTMDEAELWAALAVKPIDDQALEARGDAWGTARRSQSGGMLVSLLVIATVAPIYLLGSFVPLLIGGPIIAIVCVYLAIRAIGPGGEMDAGYERLSRSLTPLGLGVAARPKVRLDPRWPTMPGYSARLSGPLQLVGQRHGRPVAVRLEGGGGSGAEVRVGARTPAFDVKARDGRLRVGKDGPAAAREAFESVPSSVRWKGVRASGGEAGIVVERAKSGTGDWMCDLWLAEHLAERLRR